MGGSNEFLLMHFGLQSLSVTWKHCYKITNFIQLVEMPIYLFKNGGWCHSLVEWILNGYATGWAELNGFL